MIDFTGVRIAVTGASGFIGGRVVERLVLETGAGVQALVRGFGRVALLSRLPQERLRFRTADLNRAESFRPALEGCDLVVHCAYSSDGGLAERWRTNVEGTANIVAAACAAGVRRLVHLSTIEVYDVSGLTHFDESAPGLRKVPQDRGYGQQKVAVEELALEAHGRDLEVVVLQPGVVYGPWSKGWVSTQLTRPANEFDLLPTAGDAGACNAVYVDDVVDAVLSSLTTPGVSGERFLIVRPEDVSWGEFFDQYRRMRGLGSPIRAIPTPVLSDWERNLYRSPAQAISDKAARLLGMRPKVTLSEGMELVAAWADWFGYTLPGYRPATKAR